MRDQAGNGQPLAKQRQHLGDLGEMVEPRAGGSDVSPDKVHAGRQFKGALLPVHHDGPARSDRGKALPQSLGLACGLQTDVRSSPGGQGTDGHNWILSAGINDMRGAESDRQS